MVRLKPTSVDQQCLDWVCSNPTPPEYRENTGPDGRRRDADLRPELCKGSVDFLASSPVYAVRPCLKGRVRDPWATLQQILLIAMNITPSLSPVTLMRGCRTSGLGFRV